MVCEDLQGLLRDVESREYEDRRGFRGLGGLGVLRFTIFGSRSFLSSATELLSSCAQHLKPWKAGAELGDMVYCIRFRYCHRF